MKNDPLLLLLLQLLVKVTERHMADISILSSDVQRAVSVANDAASRIDAALAAINAAEAAKQEADNARQELADMQSQLDALHAQLGPALDALTAKIASLPSA